MKGDNQISSESLFQIGEGKKWTEIVKIINYEVAVISFITFSKLFGKTWENTNKRILLSIGTVKTYAIRM